MARKIYSKAEKRSFRKGMQAQYSKEHPLMKYVAYGVNTNYNEDGSMFGTPYSGKKYGFKTLKEAKAVADRNNKDNEYRNSRVMAAVKAKKVNVYNSYDSSTESWRYEKVKPFRE